MFLIFHDYQFSCLNPGPKVCFCNFWGFLAIFHVLQCAFLIFHLFKCFSPYSRLYSFCVSFTTYLVFLSYTRYYIVHFLFFTFYHISRPRVIVLHFPWFLIFLPYSRSYSVHLSFSTFFSVSCHIPGHTSFVSHFPHFSFFSP